MQLGSNLLGYLLDAAHGLVVELLWRELDRGIARVHTGKLDVLRDSVCYNLTLVGHGIHLNLLGTFDEAGDDHRVLL